MSKSEAALADRAVASGLVSDLDLLRLRQDLGEAPDDANVLEWLLAHGLLTKWQAAQLKGGRTQNLVLGNYKLLSPLGAGGMGTVFRAFDTRLDREVAIKVLPPSAATPDAVGRFRREALAALELRHEHVVASFELAQQGSIHYLVMELVEGPSLAAYLADKKRLSMRETARIGYEVALALEHARQQGIIHRDIKPSNILLSRLGKVKVADLGLAKFFGPQARVRGPETRTGQFMGTIDYCAPEQCQDAKRADIRSDIYSLGCTLYHCLTGKPPFPDGTEIERIMAHIELLPGEIRLKNPEVSPALAELIEKRMLAKQPDERFQTPAEAAYALAPWAKGTHAASDNPWASLHGLDGLLDEIADAPAAQKPAMQHLRETAPRRRHPAETLRVANSPRLVGPKTGSVLAGPIGWAGVALGLLTIVTAASLLWPRHKVDRADTAYDVNAGLTTAGANDASEPKQRMVTPETGPPQVEATTEGSETRDAAQPAVDVLAGGRTKGGIDEPTGPQHENLAENSLTDLERAEGSPGADLSAARVPAAPSSAPPSSAPPSSAPPASAPPASAPPASAPRRLVANQVLSPSPEWVLLYGRNQFVASRHFPSEIRQALTRLNGEGVDIKSIAFSSKGWVVLFNKNDFVSSNLPHDAEAALRGYKGTPLEVKQIVFAPNDGWLILFGRDGFKSANFPSEISKALFDLTKKSIELKCVSLTSQGGSAILYNKNDFAHRNIPAGASQRLNRWKAEGSDLKSIAFAPSGAWLITCDTTGVWTTLDGEALKAINRLLKMSRLRKKPQPIKSIAFLPYSPVTAVSFSRDGGALASGDSRGMVRIWNQAGGTENVIIAPHTKSVWGLAFDPTADRLATASDDGTIRICNWQNGQNETLIDAPCGIHALAYRPDGKILAAAGADGNAYLFDPHAGKQTAALKASPQPLWSVAFSSDGARLATAGADSKIDIWEVPMYKKLRQLQGHNQCIWSVAFSQDGRRIASAGDDGSVRIWDADSGNELHKLIGHTISPCSVRFSPDGRWLASAACHRGQPLHPGEIIVWNTSDWQFRLCPAGAGFFGVDFAPDGNILAGACTSGTIPLWRLPEKE